MEISQKHAFGSLILIQNRRKINNLTLSIMFSIMFLGVSVLFLGAFWEAEKSQEVKP